MMLRSLRDLESYSVQATDGIVGRVSSFLFDDERWVVRYLVVRTTGFLKGRRVLISPISFRAIDWSTRAFHLALTKEKIRNGPGIDADKPVCRQHELDLSRYYNYPYYGGGAGYWGMGAYPRFLAGVNWHEQPTDKISEEDAGDNHLRGVDEVRRYHIHGIDGTIGHVDDYVVDDETWAIQYLVIDTRNWWFGKKVLIAPQWATRISWEKREVHVNLSRALIKNSPTWDPTAPIDRDYESRLCDYYGQPVYWTNTISPQKKPLPRESQEDARGQRPTH